MNDIILTEKQKEAVELCVARYKAHKAYTCIAGLAGTGKAQPNDTLIPTPDGYKYLGDLKVGDYVFDAQGQPTEVLGIYPQGEKEIYKITLQEGRTLLCSDNHLFKVITDNGTIKQMTAKEMLDSGLQRKSGTNKYSIPTIYKHPAQYSEKQYIIQPYTIGAFLGDGCCKEKHLTLSSNDEEIPKKIAEIENLYCIRRNPQDYDWCFYNDVSPESFDNRGYNISGPSTKAFFKKYLSDLGTYAYEKRIPEEYKIGSVEQRLELLRGLMDTDGSIMDNKYLTMRFSSTSLQLIKDVQEIYYSLGYSHLTIVKDNRAEKYTNGVSYDLYISIPNEEKYKFFSLKRKRDIALKGLSKHTRTRYDKITISNIERIPRKEKMTCIYVDNPEHLYLTNNYLVTHNTTVVHFIIQALGLSDAQVAFISFTGKASLVLRERGCPNAMTAHKLLYKAFRNKDGTYSYIPKDELDGPYKVIVVDEVSMLDEAIWKLLLSHHIHVIALGDPALF